MAARVAHKQTHYETADGVYSSTYRQMQVNQPAFKVLTAYTVPLANLGTGWAGMNQAEAHTSN